VYTKIIYNGHNCFLLHLAELNAYNHHIISYLTITYAVEMALLCKWKYKLFFTAGYTVGGHLWSSTTISHLHSLPDTQKMMVIASETTEEEEKQSNGKLSRVHNHEGHIFAWNKQKLLLLIFTRTPGMSTASRNKRNISFKVSTVTCIHTSYSSALVNWTCHIRDGCLWHLPYHDSFCSFFFWGKTAW
jgi:hypothetical protein